MALDACGRVDLPLRFMEYPRPSTGVQVHPAAFVPELSQAAVVPRPDRARGPSCDSNSDPRRPPGRLRSVGQVAVRIRGALSSREVHPVQVQLRGSVATQVAWAWKTSSGTAVLSVE